MHRLARFCRVCGQAFKGAPWATVCPGCKVKGENMTEHDMWLTTPPDGVEANERTCGDCRHFINDFDGAGFCMRKLGGREPKDFDDWYSALDALEPTRVYPDGTCINWEKEDRW